MNPPRPAEAAITAAENGLTEHFRCLLADLYEDLRYLDERVAKLDTMIGRTVDDDPLLIFGPLQVTTVLPHGTPDEVRAEVRRAMDVCRDKASLVFFTSNTINPDVPLENIRAYWQAVLDSAW